MNQIARTDLRINKVSDSQEAINRKMISIVIPALNEQDGIGKTLLEIPRERLEKMGYDLQILVVDGNSKDETRSVAQRKGADVLVEFRRGYGRAYKTGFKNVKGDIIVTLDADATYPCSKIPDLVRILECQNLDFLSTNRLCEMEKGAMSVINQLGNFILTSFMRLFFSVDFKDSQSGMWIFRRDVLHSILPTSDGMTFSEEIKIRASKNFRTMEVPICYRKREGKAKLMVFQDGLKNFLYLLRLRVSLIVQRDFK